VKILFSMRHLGSFRLYEPVLRRLAADGHDVHIVASRRDTIGSDTDPERLLDDLPEIQWSWADEAWSHKWIALAALVRSWLDYLRYFDPAYASAPRLRLRAAERVPAIVRRVTEWPVIRGGPARRALAASLRIVERALPRQEAVDEMMREHRPDVVLITPLLNLGSPQIEVLRSARAFGAKTALCVGSWDHLSSKSLIRELPDRVFVWNETQKREAVELHRVPAERVVVTGAQCYDQWFGRTPARSREQFCAMVKLPPDRPFILWVCSALFEGSPSEARFVRHWIEEIRASADPALRTAGILVRPHPARLDEWRNVDLSDLPDVTLYGAIPVDEQSKEDYFESLYYSAAVAGLNTSAFLEAAIVGRPVHTVVLPEFGENQEGTLHFHYLLKEGGGLLRVARSFDEHRIQLAAALRAPARPDLNAGFVEAFIRPRGLDRPATETFVAAVYDLAHGPARALARSSAWTLALRLALLPVALAARAAFAHAVDAADRTSFKLQRARQKEQHHRTKAADEQRRKAQHAAERRQRMLAVEAARQAKVRAREARLEASAREKRGRSAMKEREKLRRERSKRRSLLKAQLMRRLGFGWKQAP
jgi:hypothetical protein